MKIVTRAEWGARYDRGALDPGPEPRVVIHHSYRPALTASASASIEIAAVRAIERYHVSDNGWDGIGYNFLVAPSGRVYEGRGWKYKGAHAGPVNGSSIGVCLLIDGTVTEPSDAAVQTVRALLAEGLEQEEIAANYIVSGHRDHMAGRTCPGDKVYARLQDFRHDAGPVPQVVEEPLIATIEPPNMERIILPDRRHFEVAARLRGKDTERMTLRDWAEVAEAVFRIAQRTGVKAAKYPADALAAVLEETE